MRYHLDGEDSVTFNSSCSSIIDNNLSRHAPHSFPEIAEFDAEFARVLEAREVLPSKQSNCKVLIAIFMFRKKCRKVFHPYVRR